MIIIKNKSLLFRILLFMLGLNFSVLLFYLDFQIIGPEITFTLVYILPIAFVSWFSGRVWGFILSVICITEWYLVSSQQHFIFENHFMLAVNIILKLSIYLFIVYLLSRLKILLEKEKQVSHTDYLTNTLNRKGLYKALNLEISRAKRNQETLSVAFIDLDNFKSINDQFGHHAGDKYLKNITKIISQNIRATDSLARIGGDEFVLVFPSTDMENIKTVIEKLNKGIREIKEFKKLHVSFSIGVGVFINLGYDADAMIKLTDALMYQVKNSTKNGTVYRVFE